MLKIIMLHNNIKIFVKNKIRDLSNNSITTSTKDYYINKERIAKIESLWIQIRIIPETIDLKYLIKYVSLILFLIP